MRQTQNFSGFVHSQAYVKTIACLVLVCGGALPTLAASETLSSPKVENVQQNGITVKGVVKDTNGEPIIGATVMEKGTKNGTVTDIDGKYSLSVKRGATIEVTYIVVSLGIYEETFEKIDTCNVFNQSLVSFQ